MRPLSSFSMFVLAEFLAMASCTQSSTNRINTQEKTLSTSDEARYMSQNYVELKHPEWSKNATIYEVNVCQYTKEGTFKAFEAHLPRLKEMGGILYWQ